MSGQNGLAYNPAAGITWVKDAGQTLLTDGLGGRLWILQGLEAAAWDLLVLGYSFESAARSLALLAGSGDEGGRAALSAMVRRWQGAGLLCVPEGNRP
jgi:hypothetical protein